MSIVSSIISKLGLHKACGLFGIPAIVLKKRALKLASVLSGLYNRYFDASCFPDCWKSSSLVPIFKKSSKLSYPLNY